MRSQLLILALLLSPSLAATASATLPSECTDAIVFVCTLDDARECGGRTYIVVSLVAYAYVDGWRNDCTGYASTEVSVGDHVTPVAGVKFRWVDGPAGCSWGLTAVVRTVWMECLLDLEQPSWGQALP